MIIFTASLIFAFVASRSLLLLSWDEFSHWGQVARYLVGAGQYPSTGTILFDGYPFGAAIWQVLIGGNSEQNWIFAQSVLKFGGLLPLFAGISWKRPYIYVPLAAVLFGLLHFFFGLGDIGDILIDAPLAIYAAAALVIYFKGRDLTSILLASIVIAALPLLKDMALVFALFVSGVILFDQAAERLIERTPWRGKTLVACALPAVSAYIVNKIRVAMLGPIVGFNFSFSWEAVQSTFYGPGFDDRLYLTLQRLVEAFSVWQFAYPNMNLTFTLSVVALTMLAGVAVQVRNSVQAPISFAILSVCGYLAYLALLIFVYLFTLTSYEGERLSSFQRYSNTFLLLVSIAALSFVVVGKPNWVREGIRTVALCALAFILSGAILERLPLALYPATDRSYEARVSVNKLAAAAPVEVKNGARSYVLWNGTDGEPFYMTMYALTPTPINRTCFSVGELRSKDDVWTCDVDINWFQTVIVQYDYLLIGSLDTQFSSRFSPMFSTENPSVGWYAVEKDGAGKFVALRPIAPTL